MLKNSDGNWIDDQHEIARMIYHHFTQICSPRDNRDINSFAHVESIDLVLRELHLPSLSEAERHSLLAPFISDDI